MQERLQNIDKVTEAFQSLCRDLTIEQLNTQPDAATWSIARIIDHIITVNSTYFPIIDALKKGTYKPPFHARFGFIVDYLGAFILQSVLPGNRKKIKTFPVWEPTQSQVSGDIISRFISHQEELKKAMQSCDTMIQKGVVIHSPASKVIVYKLDKAFDIITAHEERHLQQAKEIKNFLFG